MQRYVEWIVRFPRTVIGIVLVITAYLALQVKDLEVIVDAVKFMPGDHPYVQVTSKVEKLFGLKDVAVIGVSPKQGDVFIPDVLKKVQRLTAALSEMPEVLRGSISVLGT